MATKFSENTQTGLDANSTSTVSSSLDIAENNWVCYTILANTGTHATHVITLQCSPDDTNWYNTASTITGVGIIDNVQIGARYVRLKVTTAEGGTSTVDVIIQGK